jgi:exodeoxyribonuclease-1
LSPEEREEWDAWRFDRLTDPDAGASITLDAYQERIAVLRAGTTLDSPQRLALLDELDAWSDLILDAST